MSFDGNLTGLQLSTISELLRGNGFIINPESTAYQGEWSVSDGNSQNQYIQGSLTKDTVLYNLTRAIPKAYNDYQNNLLSAGTYRNLISIGSTTIPALGNSKPPTLSVSLRGGYVTAWPTNTADGYDVAQPVTSNSDRYFSNGFLATIARQAYYEFYSGSQEKQYQYFTNTLNNYYSYAQLQNQLIFSYVNMQNEQSATFSSVNDLTSGGVASVNSDFKNFGNDLINSGKVINLANIGSFGLPSQLLKTLYANKAVTSPLALALLVSCLTDEDFNIILNGTSPPSKDQEKKVYLAFQSVDGTDFDNIKTLLNIATEGLTTVADLLNPAKLLPNSYQTLTIPEYADPWGNNGSNKNLINVYAGNGINPNMVKYNSLWGNYLTGVLPDDVALGAGAFGYSMLQINNIVLMDINKLSQSISNLRTVDVPLSNNTNGPYNSVQTATNALNMIAKGGGSNGSFRMCDFFGSMSGGSYRSTYGLIQELLAKYNFQSLANIYSEMYRIVNNTHNRNYDDELQPLIDQANSQISNIKSTNTDFTVSINNLWNTLGTNLYIEQRSIVAAAPSQDFVTLGSSNYDIQTFGRSIETYAQDTGEWGMAQVLLDIADLGKLGGQFLAAAVKEAQNASVLKLSGGNLVNGISSAGDPQQASGTAMTDSNGCISFTVTNGGTGYTKESCDCCMPTVYVAGGMTQATPVVDMTTGKIIGLKFSGGKQCGYPPNTTIPITISPPAVPDPLGYPVTLGSLVCGDHDLIPPNLRTPA